MGHCSYCCLYACIIGVRLTTHYHDVGFEWIHVSCGFLKPTSFWQAVFHGLLASGEIRFDRSKACLEHRQLYCYYVTALSHLPPRYRLSCMKLLCYKAAATTGNNNDTDGSVTPGHSQRGLLQSRKITRLRQGEGRSAGRSWVRVAMHIKGPQDAGGLRASAAEAAKGHGKPARPEYAASPRLNASPPSFTAFLAGKFAYCTNDLE